jgi:hypothetical protein
MKQQTNNIWKEIAIGLIIIIFTLIICLAISKAIKDQKQLGYEIGVNQTIQEIALSQVQTGNILVYNGTAITTMPITQICQNLIDAQEVKK